jgi:hypothetical protein
MKKSKKETINESQVFYLYKKIYKKKNKKFLFRKINSHVQFLVIYKRSDY